MKKTAYKISAAFASLALAGTCFAAPAMAETSSQALFGSLGGSSATTPVTTVETEPATSTTDGFDVEGAGMDVDIDALLAELGVSSSDIEAMLEGDFSGIAESLDLSGVSSELDSLTAQIEEGLNDLLDSIMNEVANFIDENTQILDPVDFADLNAVAVEGETVSVDGVSFLLPEGYYMETLDLAELAEETPELAAYADTYEELGSLSVVTIGASENGQVAFAVNSGDLMEYVTDADELEGGFTEALAEVNEMAVFGYEGIELSGGKVTLADGTETFMCTFSNEHATSADDVYALAVVVIPTSDTTFTTFSIAYTGEASVDDMNIANAILWSLGLAE